MTNKFIELIENSRFFEVQYNKLIEEHVVDKQIIKLLTDYFVSYVNYFKISPQEIEDTYMNFLNEFRRHLKTFAKTNQYPYQYNEYTEKKRFDYDIPLLCSTFLAYHRYVIFETLYKKITTTPQEKTLIVGIGAGIELAILKNKTSNIWAYDTNIGEFIKHSFSAIHFQQDIFKYDLNQRYDTIILIELLEHLQNPFILLEDALKSITPHGRVHFTTAINVPQFDHLYNFYLDDKNIETCIENQNCEIEYKLDIPHQYIHDVKAYNCYYIVKRKN